MDIEVRSFRDFVVGASTETPATAIVLVFANVLVVKISRARTIDERADVRRWLDVVDSSAIPIIGAADQDAPTFVLAKTPADGAHFLGNVSAAKNGSKPSDRGYGDCRAFAGGLGDDVDRSTDAISVHVRLEGFIDFHRFDQVRGHGIEFDLAHTRFRRRNIHAVNGGIREARFEAAHLDIFALAFVALKRNARQTADGVGHIGIGERSEHFVGQDLDDVVGGALAVDGFYFARNALGGDQNLFVRRRDFHLHISNGGLPCGYRDRLGEKRKTDIGNRKGVGPGSQVVMKVFALRSGLGDNRSGLQFHFRALQDAAREIGYVAGYSPFVILRQRAGSHQRGQDHEPNGARAEILHTNLLRLRSLDLKVRAARLETRTPFGASTVGWECEWMLLPVYDQPRPICLFLNPNGVWIHIFRRAAWWITRLRAYGFV